MENSKPKDKTGGAQQWNCMVNIFFLLIMNRGLGKEVDTKLHLKIKIKNHLDEELK